VFGREVTPRAVSRGHHGTILEYARNWPVIVTELDKSVLAVGRPAYSPRMDTIVCAAVGSFVLGMVFGHRFLPPRRPR